MNPFVFPAIGVDISDESFKYLRFREHPKVREIDFFGEEALPKGIIESGEIKDARGLSKKLAETLEKFIREAPYMILSLPEEKGFLRLIQMPYVEPAEIRNALVFQLEAHIPYDPDKLIFDYDVITVSAKKGSDMEVIVTAYPKDLVDSYVAAAEEAGFIPLILELESQAVARAVVPRGAQNPILVGDIGRTRTTFSIIYKGHVEFTSTVKLGGRDIDKVLMDSLHITAAEAADVKIGRGLDVSSEDIIHTLTPVITSLKEEVDRQLEFWEHRHRDSEDRISKMYLCGGDAHLKGLPEFLSRELRVPVERARIWENLFDLDSYIPTMRMRDTLRYATALGLAMRSGETISGL